MPNTYFNRTPASAGNRKIWTWSGWVKKSANASQTCVFSAGSDPSSNLDIIAIWDSIDVYSYSGAYAYRLTSTAVFRDPSAWYHLVVALDTTQATNTNRLKIYMNGTQVTSFTTTTYPSQNADSYHFNNTSVHYLGRKINEHYWDGYMSNVYFIDGQQLDATSFGETDATTGIWKPKSYTGSYGTNGFFLKFENSGSLGTDSSGNGNNFTVNGTPTQTVDTPSNVFATLNPLNVPASNAPTFENGNTVSQTSTGDPAYFNGTSTLGVSSGKYYWEVKCISGSASNAYFVGITPDPAKAARLNAFPGQSNDPEGYSIYANDGNYWHNGDQGSYASSYTTGDIISVALDLDNNKLYFAKNGTWQNSGVPTSGATGTGAISITAPSSTTSGYYHSSSGSGGGAVYVKTGHNFGNGYFGSTAISSPYSDGAGLGKFQYQPPTGYYSLCTKNINSQG